MCTSNVLCQPTSPNVHASFSQDGRFVGSLPGPRVWGTGPCSSPTPSLFHLLTDTVWRKRSSEGLFSSPATMRQLPEVGPQLLSLSKHNSEQSINPPEPPGNVKRLLAIVRRRRGQSSSPSHPSGRCGIDASPGGGVPGSIHALFPPCYLSNISYCTFSAFSAATFRGTDCTSQATPSSSSVPSANTSPNFYCTKCDLSGRGPTCGSNK